MVLPASAQAPDHERFARWILDDAASMVEVATSSSAFHVMSAMVLLAPFTALDEPMSDQLADRYRSGGLTRRYLDATNELGGPPMALLAATVFGASLATDDRRFQDAAFTSLESLAAAGAVTYAVKYASGRVRPEDGNTAFRFRPFSGHTSFPSGHATAAVALLTPWAYYYPGPITTSLLALGAGGTVVARIGKEKHWPTDIVAGAAIGFLTARHLSLRHQRIDSRDESSIDVAFVPMPGADAPVALTVRVTF